MQANRFVKRFRDLATHWSYKGKPRSNYRAVWNTQARTARSAKLGVGGFTDEEEFQQTAERTLDTLQRTVGIAATDHVLEIGAGVGRVGRVVAPLCELWIGADVSERMLGHLRSRLADLANVRAVAISGYDLQPIPDHSVDVVYCTVVFMHLDEWERYAYVREGHRVLKPGGRLFVDNFNLLSDEGWKIFEEHCRIPASSRLPHASRSSTPQELDTYFRRAGFESVHLQEQAGWIIGWGMKPA